MREKQDYIGGNLGAFSLDIGIRFKKRYKEDKCCLFLRVLILECFIYQINENFYGVNINDFMSYSF